MPVDGVWMTEARRNEPRNDERPATGGSGDRPFARDGAV
jgi:hypothetical protein